MKDGKYEEALERAMQGMPIDEVFPELKESDDERIRKDLITFICQFAPEHLKVKYVAYLEKQKEQKPAEQLGGTFTSYDMAKTFTEGQNYVIAHPEKFGLCKPAEWSEEEERHLYNAIEAVKYVYDISEGTNGFKCIEFLKSFRPQPHWKPSEEQMTALEASYSVLKTHDTWGEDEHLPLLLSLCNDLKNYFSDEKIH